MTTRTPITRAFSDQILRVGSAFDLPQDQRHHFENVLRAAPGDVFEVVSRDRNSFLAEVLSDGRAVVLEETSGTGLHHIELELYQAVPKGKRMEMVVEKAVEIGVTRVIPILTDHSVVRVQEGNKVERWRRISESAARQALREEVPEIASPMSFDEAIRDGGVMLHNAEGLARIEDVPLRPARIFVGPEGGWSNAELRTAEENGVTLASLGEYRLRSETAGIVGVVRARAMLEQEVREQESRETSRTDGSRI